MESRNASSCMRAVIIASGLLLVVTALEWSLIDLLTPLLYPILLLVVAAVFVVAAAWAFVSAIANRRRGWRGACPLLIVVVAGSAVLLTPFTDLWLSANYKWYRSDRLRIVREVQAGRINLGRGGLVALGRGEPYVSVGGNEILVEEHDGGHYVFFFTFRGVLDNYSGFLFVPEGGAPTQFRDLDEAESTRLKQLEPGWYFASHR